MAKAYICGILQRNKAGKFELTRIGVYSAPASQLTCMDDRRYCDFLTPTVGKSFSEAKDEAMAVANEYAKYLGVGVDEW